MHVFIRMISGLTHTALDKLGSHPGGRLILPLSHYSLVEQTIECRVLCQTRFTYSTTLVDKAQRELWKRSIQDPKVLEVYSEIVLPQNDNLAIMAAQVRPK